MNFERPILMIAFFGGFGLLLIWINGMAYRSDVWIMWAIWTFWFGMLGIGVDLHERQSRFQKPFNIALMAVLAVAILLPAFVEVTP